MAFLTFKALMSVFSVNISNGHLIERCLCILSKKKKKGNKCNFRNYRIGMYLSDTSGSVKLALLNFTATLNKNEARARLGFGTISRHFNLDPFNRKTNASNTSFSLLILSLSSSIHGRILREPSHQPLARFSPGTQSLSYINVCEFLNLCAYMY